MLSPRESHGSHSTDRSITTEPDPALEKRYRDFGYQLDNEIGRGRMGIVHRAIHTATGIPVAIKRLRDVDAEGLHDLKREFRTLFGGEHRGIAKVYELAADPEEPFFAMELIDGEDLVSWVRRNHRPHDVDEPLIERVVDAVGQLSTTLMWLHRTGRVHRDVKPSNVRVQDGRVVLVDFDLAALIGGAHRSVPDSAGTLAYMPNEALWGGETTTSGDVYALGALAYECLTGERAFPSADAVELHRQKSRGVPALPSEVPTWLSALVTRMASPDPSARPAAIEVMAAVRNVSYGDQSAGWSSAEAVELQAKRAVEELVKAYDARDRDTPSLFCISGAGAAGIPRVVNELLRHAQTEPGCQIIEGRCVPSVAVPFQGVDSVVDALVEMLLQVPPSEAEGLVPREVAELLELFPVMARLSPFQDAVSDPSPHGSAIDRRLRAFEGLRSVLEAVSRRGPLVVVVDDLQWADEQSLRFWADVLAGTTPLVLVAVARNDEAFASLQLGEGGVALEVHLTSYGAEDEPLQSIPPLAPVALKMLQACSVAFAPVDAQILGQVIGAKSPMIPIAQLIRAGGLIQHDALEPRMKITPRDEGVRSVVDESLSQEERRALHLALAEALAASEDDVYAVAAFWHWHAADAPERARSFAWSVGARLMTRMAFEQAASVYEAALLGGNDDDTIRLTTLLAEALEASGHGKSAAEAFARAVILVERRGGSAREVRELRRRSAEAYLRAGYVAEGNDMLDAMLPELAEMPRSNLGLLGFLFKERARRALNGWLPRAARPKRESDERLDALWSATVGTVWADLSRTMYYQVLHAGAADRCEDPVHRARAKATEGCYLAAISPRLFGRAGERLGAESLAIAEELGDPDLIAMARSTWATTAFLRGDWAATIERCSSIADWVEHECSAAQWELSTAYLYSAWSLGFRGDLRAIERFRTKVLQRGRAHDDRLALTCVSVGLPNLTWLGRGRPDLARAGTREAMGAWRSPSYSPIHFFALVGETLADLYCGDSVEARGRFEVQAQALRQTFLGHHPIVRPLLHYLNVQTALAAIQRAPAGVAEGRMRRSARRSCWRLKLERAPWSEALSHGAHAAWESMYGSPEALNRRLLLAEQSFANADMALYAEAARFHRTRLCGGTPARFTAPMAEPAAMAYCLMPIAAPRGTAPSDDVAR